MSCEQGRIFNISLGGGGGGGGVDKSWGGVICSLITGSLGGASRRLTRVNFFLTLGCSLGATLLTQFKTYYSFHYS